MTTVTKKELIDRIADETDQSRVMVKETVQRLLDHLILEMGAGNRVEFRDFGVFEPRQRAPRLAQNPKTHEPVQIPAKRIVKFKAGRLMQKSVENPNGAMRELKVAYDAKFREDGAVVSRDRTRQESRAHGL